MLVQWLTFIAVIVVIAIALFMWFAFRENYFADTETRLIAKKCPPEILNHIIDLNKTELTDVIAPDAKALTAPRGNELIKPSLRGKYGRFTIASLSTGVRSFSKYTLGSVEQYSKEKGHELIIRKESYPIPNKLDHPGIKNPNWGKLFWLRELLDTIDTDYLVWIDDDILVTNNKVDFESFIDRDPNKDLFISYDRIVKKFLFPVRALFNGGVLLFRNSEGSRRILDAAIDTYYTFTGWNWVRFNDQTAIEYVYLTTNGEGFNVIPHGSLQALHCVAFDIWKPNDFMCHLAGKTTEGRTMISRRMIAHGYVPGLTRKQW